jgi:hypothetical protein
MEYRLTKLGALSTNGMFEPFNGSFVDLLKTQRFTSGEDLGQAIMRYMACYNHQLTPSVFKSKTLIRAMKDWYMSHPHPFIKLPFDHLGYHWRYFKVGDQARHPVELGSSALRR